MDSATSTAKEDASKEGKTTTHPELEMAPSVSEGEELTPEEVQLVSHKSQIIINNTTTSFICMTIPVDTVLQKLLYNLLFLRIRTKLLC